MASSGSYSAAQGESSMASSGSDSAAQGESNPWLAQALPV